MSDCSGESCSCLDGCDLADLEGVVVSEDGRVRAKMARNAKGGSVNE